MTPHLDILALALAVPVLLWVSFTDLRERRIPNNVIFPALAVALPLALLRPERWWLLLGGLALFAIMLLPWIVFQERRSGGGDVKLALFLGLTLGLGPGLIMLIIAYGCAAAFGIGGLLLGRLRLRSKIAFAPFLSLSALGVGSLMVLSRWG